MPKPSRSQALLVLSALLAVLALLAVPHPLHANTQTVATEVVYFGEGRDVGGTGAVEPAGELEVQVRFINQDNRPIEGLTAWVNVLQGQAVVARFELEAEEIPPGQGVLVAARRGAGVSETAEARILEAPGGFTTQVVVRSVEWGEGEATDVEPEETARGR